MTVAHASPPARERALFLDVDGTLIEHADTPDAVHVPELLKDLLARLASQEAGALALVSGRTIARLDELFAPLHLPAAGLHGLERRDAIGRVFRSPCPATNSSRAYERALVDLHAFAARHAGVLVEDKGLALALHYRRAPELANEAGELMASWLHEFGPAFQLQPGKGVFELKPSTASKRTAIEAFMEEAPFVGRTPIFVGDDATDEDGFEAVNRLGGESIRVGRKAATRARRRLESVSEVTAWLLSSLAMENAR